MKTTAIIVMLIGTMLAQNTYEVQPGTKGNEIKLTIANVSEINPATNVIIKSLQPLGFQESPIKFHQPEQTIELLNAGEEKEITFTFDVGRNISINKKDTIEFKITSPDGIMMTKQFIFSYTGPKEFKLEQNYPNPFNPVTNIKYDLKENSFVELKIFDVLGNELATLVNQYMPAGSHTINFNASGLPSGIYIYKIIASDFTDVKKFLIMK